MGVLGRGKPAARRPGRPALYKFNKLEVGDPFFVDVADRHLARAAATAYKARHPGWDYKSETVGELIKFVRTA